jgi:glutamate--cysteine ligase
MPSARRILTQAHVDAYVREHCFVPQAGHVGAEVEWITLDAADPARHVSFDRLESTVRSLEPLPGGSRITFEPGGQLELSSSTHASPGSLCESTAADIDLIRGALEPERIVLAGIGLDPARDHRRVLDTPRYAAMEAYFDSGGTDGRRMMCRTASIQVNLDGGDGDAPDRWRRAHWIGPTLAAAFANSPFSEGKPAGRQSTRLATWWAMDGSRTAPARSAGNPVDAWTRYALAAHVMLIRASEERYLPIDHPMTFGEWMAEGHELGFPTEDDLAYHITTLFPPVRARGWLELRMIDALPEPWWRVAVAVTAALLDDAEAAEAADRSCADTKGLWKHASRHGLSHPALARSARDCFAVALEALPRIGADPATIAATAAFIDRYVSRARCPADDLLHEWSITGSFATPAAEPIWT